MNQVNAEPQGGPPRWEAPGGRRWPRRWWLLAAGLVALAAVGVVIGVDDDEDAELPIEERDEPAGREDAEPPAGFGDEDDWRLHPSVDSTHQVASAPDGTVWAATTAAGLLHWDPEEGAYDRHVPDGIRRVAAVAVGSDGTVWAAAEGGNSGPDADGRSRGALVRFDGQGWEHFAVGEDLPPVLARGVRSLAVDDAGDVWVAAPDAVVAFDGDDWRLYRADGGLPHPQVVSVLVDGDGSVWARTRHRPAEPVGDLAGGLARYDDGEWTSWTTEDGDLAFDQVVAVTAGADRSLWAVTRERDRGQPEREAAMLRLQDEGWAVEVAGGPELGEVASLAVDAQQTVWAAVPHDSPGASEPGAHRVARLDEDGLTTDGVSELAPGQLRSLAVDDAGELWAGTSQGVARLDGERWERYVTGLGPAGDRVRSVAQDRHGAVWTATEAGVSRFDGDDWAHWTAADGLAADDVTEVAVADDGAVWAATSGGVSRFDGDGWTTWTGDDGLAGDAVESLATGADGGVWAAVHTPPAQSPNGDAEGGLARYDGTRWAHWSTDELGEALVPTSIAVDADGEVWVSLAQPEDEHGALEPAGLARFDDREWTLEEGLVSDQVSAVAADDGQTVWAATARGVARFDGHEWAVGDDLGLDFGHPVRHGPITALASDDGEVWVAAGESLHHFDGGRWNSTDDVPASPLHAIEPGQQRLWVGTSAGLATSEP